MKLQLVVRNSVLEVTRLADLAYFRYIQSEINQAVIPSRGAMVEDVGTDSMWQVGMDEGQGGGLPHLNFRGDQA